VLGNALVVALFALWLIRPWRRAMRDLATRRTGAADWGTALSEPPAGAEAEAVTLRGTLEADGPVALLEGPETAAITLHGSPTGDGHLIGDGLRLRMGEVVIPIEGRVEVLVGALEEHPRSVREKTEYRFAESKLMAKETEEKPPKRAQLRRIPSGSEVIVHGHLERRATGGSQYREGANGWALVTGKHGEPTVLAAAAPKAVRFPGQDWLLRTLGLGLLVFVLLPLGLEHGGEWLADEGNDVLRDCDPAGHRWLTAADWVARVEGAFPAFGEAALDQRRDAAGLAVNGIRVCGIGEEEAPAGWIDPLVPLARERLPALQEHEYFDGLRSRLEETLHEAGRDRSIVELQRDLPKGGDITERVRAHLYLGDLDGALATWEEPGAELSVTADAVLQKGAILCLAGRAEEALEAFDEHLDAMSDHESDLWRQRVVFRDGLCALRAGNVERAERRAVELSGLQYAADETDLLQARVAAERGELTEWSDRELREPASLLVAVALAEAQEWDRLLAFLERSPLDYRFGATPIDRMTAGIYNEIFFPELNTGQLERLAETLEVAAPALATPDEESETERSEGIAEPMGRALQNRATREAALRRAGEIHRYLAVLYGRRWDPRADGELDEAERLLGADAVASLRDALAFFHGDWERSREARSRDIRNLSRLYRGEEVESDFSLEVREGRTLGLALLHPSRFEAEHAIAALYRYEPPHDVWSSENPLPWVRAWHRIRVQELRGTWATIFYRLTHVVVHGEQLGFDVNEERAQLRALRALFDEQPDPYLLVGPDGSAEL
jgi:tetratricopeptide (TPR) repeat protein